MSLPGFSVRRPVAVSMLFLAVALLGALSFGRLPIDLLPDVSYPRLVVYTSYPEVAPGEVERLVTEPVEAQVATVPQVERVSSVSREGVSMVTLRFAWGTDMDFATLNVREKLDNARGRLPDLATRPQILRVDPESEPIMVLSVAGDDLWETKELAENVFRRRLEQLDGIAQATATGGLDREIVVEVDPSRLEAYGVSIQTIADALDRANQTAVGGTILEGRTRFPLRTVGEFRTVSEIEDVVVGEEQTEAGATRPVRVRDVAAVRDGFADREGLARYNRREAVGLLIFKESGANTVEVAERVDEVVQLLGAEFTGISLDVAHSQAGFISDSIDNVVSALVLGGMLAFLVLFLFLREPRYPVVVALAIPISIVATFALMDIFGVSLNIMSLGGLALGVGMLVDNSIIVLENIFRHREAGVGAEESAAEGAEEVTGAITASTLTTIAVFLPIVYVEGVAGELFRDLSLAVAFSLLASLVVALTLLPMLAARFRPVRGDESPPIVAPTLTPGPRPESGGATLLWVARTGARAPGWALRGARGLGAALVRFWGESLAGAGRHLFRRPLRSFDRGFEAFALRYESVLEWALSHRAGVLLVAGGALGVSLVVAPALDRDLLPSVDQGAFEVELEMPRGTPLDRTDAVAGSLEAVLLADPDVDAVFGTVGRDAREVVASEEARGQHTARLQARLGPGASTNEVAERISGDLAGTAPDGEVTLRTGGVTALGQFLGGREADIAVRLLSPDLDGAFAYAERLARALRESERLENVRLGSPGGHPEFEVDILREEVARFRLEAADVAREVEQGMRGALATEFVEFDRKIPIVVRLPDALRYDLRTLERLQIDGVPLREVVRVTRVTGPSEVTREDQSRVVTVLADVRRGGLDAAIAQVESAVRQVPPSDPDLRLEIGGESEEMRRSFRDLALAFGLALILVYMILAAQFESVFHPGTILAAVPLALIGAVWALLLAGQGLNTMSLIGCVILVGIVVNDSIVKVDFIVQARERGLPTREAIMEAGRIRLRPIVMTTVTTVLGLTPMALGVGRGADLRAPLAIAVIGGLSAATLLTLVVVPVLFSLVEELRERLTGSRTPTEVPKPPLETAEPAR